MSPYIAIKINIITHTVTKKLTTFKNLFEIDVTDCDLSAAKTE
jgi:hypothetical protein